MENVQAKAEPSPEYGKIDTIIENYANKKSSFISILQDIENMYKYLPGWALKYVSEKLKLPLIQVYGVASFYDAFHLEPQGKHVVRVCLGTACYLRGGARVLQNVEKELGVKDGKTTPDREFSVQSVRCLGACALAPVLVVDEQYFDKTVPSRVGKILKQVQKTDAED